MAESVLDKLQQKRYILMIMGFFGFFNVYAMRVNLSVAVVHMQNEFNWGTVLKGMVRPQRDRPLTPA
jgi:hypothetical protein